MPAPRFTLGIGRVDEGNPSRGLYKNRKIHYLSHAKNAHKLRH